MVTLTEQQNTAFNLLTDFAERPKGGIFLLEGYAGTGKTFLVSHFVKSYGKTHDLDTVAMSAPTNKAVKVLRNVSEGVNCKTIHQLLGLTERINSDGTISFKPAYNKTPSIREYSLVIVDEVSMLSDEIFAFLTPYVGTSGLKLIFVGDPAQIPPIGKEMAMPFDAAIQQRHMFSKVTLVDIVRQAKDSPIIFFSTRLRNTITGVNTLQEPLDHVENDANGSVQILYQDVTNTQDILTELITKYFISEDFDRSADYVKIIAWRNSCVDMMNKEVRKLKYNTSDKLVVGEQLLANSPIWDDDRIVFFTNDEFEVVGFEDLYETIPNSKGNIILKYHRTNVKGISVDGDEVLRNINIISRDSEYEYKRLLQSIANAAKKEGVVTARQSIWETFYAVQRSFADVKYNYAITAHKSQASTYTNTIVFENDMDVNMKVTERNKIKYTAFTRASKNLIVIR